jgi:hypothetical protein
MALYRRLRVHLLTHSAVASSTCSSDRGGRIACTDEQSTLPLNRRLTRLGLG